MPLLARVLWLALPVILAGAVHIAVIRLHLLPGLARLPLDGGTTFRGRRLLGDHKTVRGAVVMACATTVFAGAEGALAARSSWARGLSLVSVHPLLWGLLLGLGYVAGELPNSFLKRQLDVAPGEAAPGSLAPVFWLADQLDSLCGVLTFMACVWTPPLAVIALLGLVTLVVHPTMAFLMMGLGLKERIG